MLIAQLAATVFLPEVSVAASVTVNDRELSQQQIEALAGDYGIQVVPGDYWYDRKTGAWGNKCGPGRGILLPDLELGGVLKADASCGNTGVFVNGRELHRQDLVNLQLLAGHIAPGRYWMDAQLNAGREGGPALVNYQVLAVQQTMGADTQHGGGNAGGADHFWSTGYSAGNSSADGSYGYVSVPGYGPVGYGY